MYTFSCRNTHGANESRSHLNRPGSEHRASREFPSPGSVGGSRRVVGGSPANSESLGRPLPDSLGNGRKRVEDPLKNVLVHEGHEMASKRQEHDDSDANNRYQNKD